MLPIISERDGNRIKIELTVALSGSILEAEESILRAVNAVGNVATGEGLKRFDADGDPIVVGARDGTRRASRRRFIILITMFCAPGLDPRVQGSGLLSSILAPSYYLLRPRFRMAHAFNVIAKRCIFLGGWKRRYQLTEKDVISPDALLSALKRYLEESGDTEQAVASKIGMNHHTLHRWLSDNESPKKGGGKLALTALFLRRAGYL